MDMNGSQRIEASREAVYAGLNDVDILRQCIPGCESIEKTSETEMVAKVTLRIGPVKASFAGTVTLSDLDPPNGYTISGEGSGGMAGFAKGGANVTLEPDGDATILHYVVKAEIGGKLAQMGSRLIDSTAKKLAGDFFAKFGEVVGKPSDVEAPPEEQAASKGWMSRILGSSATAFLAIVLAPGLL
ncbi:carbon monoxide dehydrogenase subunit G [Peteryoungia aggregata LMG 23059]|uniref:Carbon monoxide dehydrogenase subunit G n=1 Tax=Peteryoungia aggregata LMG 23059 TaxID=1368425 RepID=A0ABU0GCH1_9HYPH|nr:carbon monoxide dehydrogenase subunit G [Peteryoungia aggregata]MDQ0422436.1 carbon monoxide dehydrogenase subunit G [Peteryoungia aggregata LMG 23059]